MHYLRLDRDSIVLKFTKEAAEMISFECLTTMSEILGDKLHMIQFIGVLSGVAKCVDRFGHKFECL